MDWEVEKLTTIRDQHDDWLMSQPFVSGTAIGLDDKGLLCIKILTDMATAQQRETVRERLKDAPVFFEEVGPIDALDP